jgi:crotonobetainyl-CoA:carnitine CoA-transferase CaiB-like acyl-CoA transferase
VSDDAIAYAGRAERRMPDPLLHGFSALYRLYETAEGWLFLAAPKPREWEALAPCVGLEGDARFATAEARAENDGALGEALAAVFRTRPAAAWERDLTLADVAGVEVAAGPMPRVVMEEPWYREAGFLADVVHPTFGPHARLAPLASLGLTPGAVGPAPVLGQDTARVLGEIGYDDAAIEALAARRIVRRATDPG